MALLKNALIGFGFLVLLFFVIRPLMKIVRKQSTPVYEGFSPLQESEEQLEHQHRVALAAHAASQMQLIDKVKQDPYQTAQILQNWLQQRD